MSESLKDKILLPKSKTPYYKYCYVRSCKNTSVSTPDKQFISVPSVPEKRKAWLSIAGYPPGTRLTGTRFCCEDHLDLKNDVDNYREIQFHGGGRKRLKEGVLPRFKMTASEDSSESDAETESPEMDIEDDKLDVDIDIKHETVDIDADDMDENNYNIENISTTGFTFVNVDLSDVRAGDPFADNAGKKTCQKWTQTEEKTYENKHVQAKVVTRVKRIQTSEIAKRDQGV